MCFSSAPKVKPIAAAPTASPEVVDDTAINDRNAQRRRLRQQYGRQQTIIGGRDSASAGAPPTAPVKTALGS